MYGLSLLSIFTWEVELKVMDNVLNNIIIYTIIFEGKISGNQSVRNSRAFIDFYIMKSNTKVLLIGWEQMAYYTR